MRHYLIGFLRGQALPAWLRPINRPTSIGAGSGSTSNSGRVCPRANRWARWASWIWQGCEGWCRTGNHSRARAFKRRLRCSSVEPEDRPAYGAIQEGTHA